MIESLIAPLVGGGIGLITNTIAIKMLFRPLKPIKVFNKELLFTQGVIPKERARIAKSVGDTIAKELLNEKNIKNHLLTPYMYGKIEAGVEKWFKEQCQQTHTLQELIAIYKADKIVEEFLQDMQVQLNDAIIEQVKTANLGKQLADEAADAIQGNLGAFAMLMNGAMIESAKARLEEIINQMIDEQAGEFVEKFLTEQKEKMLEQEVSDVFGSLQEHLPKIKYIVLKQYKALVEGYSQEILEALDISKIVEDAINAMDLLTLEQMILEVMQKELRAIIALGGVLGAIMGMLFNFL